MNNLTKQDIDLLIEALDKWEESGSQGRAMSMMLTALVSRSREDYENNMSSINDEQEASRIADKLKKERSIMLKAKLISIRDLLEADELFQQTEEN